MTTQAIARSVSRSARERLHRLHRSHAGQLDARVLAVFERACALVTPDGEVMALVCPQIGDGPLNIVVDDTVRFFAGIALEAAVTLEGERLRVGRLEIDLEQAATWEPRPDWDALRAQRAAVTSCLALLRALCLRWAPAGSFLALLEPSLPADVPVRAILSNAQQAAKALREGWEGDDEQLQEGGARLAGLGGGLTPAGDDFLAGAMLWAWLAHPTPASLCRVMVEVAVPRTTTLSAAFLRAAARGECSAPWHALLAALREELGSEQEAGITTAVREVLAHGATSGADNLAGFLYLRET